MAQEPLNRAHVGPGFEEMDRERMAERVRSDRFGETRSTMHALTRLADGVTRDRLVRMLAGKQPRGRPLSRRQERA